MSLDFTIPELHIGNAGTPPIQFYKQGLKIGGSGTTPTYQDIVLSGNGSLSLTNAKAHGLNYLKLFGKCEQTGTPTPDTPMDIVSNNGVVKLSPNLFNGQFDTGWGISSADGSITNLAGRKSFYIKVDPTKTYTVSRSAVGSSAYFYYGTYAQQLYNTSQACVSFGNIGASALTGTITIPAGANYLAIFFGTGESPNVQLELGATATPYKPYGIYTDGTTETVEVTGKNLFDQATATRYQTSWSNAGSGYWQAVSDSYAVTYGCYVKPNTTYTLSKKGGSRLIITGYTTKTEPSSEQTTPADYKIKSDTTETIDGSYTFTTPADCTWILFGLRQNNSSFTFPYDVQLELGSTATEYEPYYNGGQATAEMLLKVGDYQDVQSVLDGNVTRKIGVKVLDGTENWTRYGTGKFATPLIGSKKQDSQQAPISSHFVGKSYNNVPVTDGQVSVFNGSIAPTSGALGINHQATPEATAFSQWLADQYNAGTPVIVIYPLATATTETVTGQPLTIQAGSNIVEITQSSMDNLGLEVSYKATV